MSAVRQDSKLKHMTDMQLSVVSEGDSRQELTSQLTSYDHSLERLHCEQFRLRCYMASLQGGELPNPKVGPRSSQRASRAVPNR